MSRWLCACLLLSSTLVAAQPTDPGAPLIWRDPGAMETRDLFWGSGSEARAPKPPFQFVEENIRGTVAKVVVTDANGDTWDVKLANEETHPEVIANRLLWGLGYLVQEMYFVHSGTIEGLEAMQRSTPALKSDGRFTGARFRRRDPSVTEAGRWAFAASPFTGRQELSGLVIAMALINNWDTADTTNKDILHVKTPGGAIEQWYIVQDLGASFGRFKGPGGTPIKWNLAEYEKDGLVARVEGDTVVLNYPAFGTPPTRIPMAHARWFVELFGRLSDAQLRTAFKAGGATEAEVEGFTRKLLAKMAELRSAVGSTSRH